MTLLLILLVKSLLVFALSGAVLLCLRRASASARHLVCLLTLSALLALPLFSLTLPGWQFAGLSSTDPTSILQQEAGLPPAPNNGGASRTEEEGAAISEGAASSAPTSSVPAPPLLGAGGHPFPWPLLLLSLYVLGVLLAAIRPLLGLWGIAHLRRACVCVTDAPTLSVSLDCAAALGLKRLPQTCRANVLVPMTWGGRRPVVLLPDGSENWSPDRLRSVLLHEMAHVKRRDWPGHRLADLVCVLYWFHPLVWLLARRLRSESEAACDDLVLASGIPAADYARHLLDIARALPPASRRHPYPTAIAMAQTPHITRRITMILDKTQSRRTLTRRVLLIALIPSAAALLTLAALRPSVKAQAAPALPVTKPSIEVIKPSIEVTMSKGSVISAPRIAITRNLHGSFLTVRSAAGGTVVPSLTIDGTTLFAGVADANKPGSPWWSASGTLLPTPVYDTNAYHAENHADSSTHNVSFAFRLPPNAADITVRYELPQSLGSSSDGSWPTKLAENDQRTEAQLFSKTNGTRVVTTAYSPSLTKTNVRVGIAAGPWKIAAVDGNLPGASGFGNKQAFLFSPVAVTKHGLMLSISNNATDDVRVVAITTQGRTILPDEIDDNNIGTLDELTAQFITLPLSQIKEIRVETRPFQWIEFKDVALQPLQQPLPRAAAIPGEPMDSVVAGQFTPKQALRLSQAQQLRDHLAGWAHQNKAALVEMQQAQPDNLAAPMRVYTSLIKLPFPLWNSDPRLGKSDTMPAFSTQTTALTLSHLQHSQDPVTEALRADFARYHDFRVANSVDPGSISLVLWASGRITQSTASGKFMGHGKPIFLVTNEKTITPPFFPQPGDNNEI